MPMKPTKEEGRAMIEAAAAKEPALQLMVEIVKRNVVGANKNLETLMNALEVYFDGDLPAAIEATRSGAIAFELADGRWRIFKVLSEGTR
jgi:hypothetical protein